jgi:hypothetical protein
MKVAKVILLFLTVSALSGVFPVEGAPAPLNSTHAAHFLGMSLVFGVIQKSVLAAGEPFELMILGIGLILLAIRLRQRREADNESAPFDASSDGLA